MIERVALWIDDRVVSSRFLHERADRIFPQSWSFLFGELATNTFIVLVLTGTYLMLFFDPSDAEKNYDGSYLPLRGVKMSAAYESTLRLSFDVRAGLFIRQVHHWAALIFVAAAALHLFRVFFTGAFRRPRELNWVIGVTLLLLAVPEGFSGYSLPDDLLSGTGMRIAYSVAESIPVVGTWLASLVFGGRFPGNHILIHLYVAHVLLIPGALILLIGVHVWLVFRQTHTQYPGGDRREDNVVGVPMYPTHLSLSAGLFFLTFGFCTALGALVQINPIWFYGPYDPFAVTIGSQPDWYMGWLEGAQRLLPAWEVQIFGYLVPQMFFAVALLPALTFGLLYAYPWIEARLTGDHAPHHLLDRARDHPLRTAVGAAGITFALVLMLAGSTDMLSLLLEVSINRFIQTLRAAAILLPLAVGLLVFRWCRDLARDKDRPPAAPAPTAAGQDGAEEEREPVGLGPTRWRMG